LLSSHLKNLTEPDINPQYYNHRNKDAGHWESRFAYCYLAK